MRQLDRGPIPSAFTAAWQGPALLLLLLVLLLLPLLASWLHLDTTRNRYLEMEGRYRYVHEVIHEQAEDLDVLFLGTCYFLSGLDIPTFRTAFSKILGRPARIEMLATKFGGEDFEYVMLRELLRRRRVTMLVTGMPGAKGSNDTPHVLAPYWLRFSDIEELGADQPIQTRVELYALAVLAAPRHFLGNLRSENSRWGDEKNSSGMEEARFCLDHSPFKPLQLQSASLAAQDWTYREGSNATRFRFEQTGMPPYRRANFQKIVDLARRNGIAMANLQMTTRPETQSTQVISDANWAKYFDYPIAQIGVPPADYFRGMDAETIDCLFWDSVHPNKNGSEYYSQIVAPSLVKAYGEKVRR